MYNKHNEQGQESSYLLSLASLNYCTKCKKKNCSHTH